MYRSVTVVGNICAYAASDKAKPIAIIVPVQAALEKMAKDNGINETFEELIHNEKMNKVVLKELQASGKAGGLAGIEIIEGVVMAEEEWNAENVRPKSSFNPEG